MHRYMDMNAGKGIGTENYIRAYRYIHKYNKRNNYG